MSGLFTRLALAALFVAALLLTSCGPTYRRPFTTEQMGKVNSADALVYYLEQPGATARVCDRTSQGPRFRRSRQNDLGAALLRRQNAQQDRSLDPSQTRLRCG